MLSCFSFKRLLRALATSEVGWTRLSLRMWRWLT